MKKLLHPRGFIVAFILMCVLSACGVPVRDILYAAGGIAITAALIWWGVRQANHPDEKPRDSDGF